MIQYMIDDNFNLSIQLCLLPNIMNRAIGLHYLVLLLIGRSSMPAMKKIISQTM